MDVPVTARAALLQALLDGKGYGLELVERVKEKTKGKINLGDGSVYPTLRGMERERLLKS